MKSLLLQFATYNRWANQLLLETINALNEEEQKRELASSFPSLHQTVLHMWNAESVWWQRLKLQERIVYPWDYFSGSMQELSEKLLEQDQLWIEWISNAQEHMLEHVCLYQNTKREQFKQPVYQMVHHVMNHNSYHRGQLVTMLRQLGITKIPQTDYIVWSRRKS